MILRLRAGWHSGRHRGILAVECSFPRAISFKTQTAAASHSIVVTYQIHYFRLCIVTLALSAASAVAQRAPTSPTEPWIPDEHVDSLRLTTTTPHDFEMQTDHVYTLPELIDIAESNDPATRAAWAQAKASANAVGIAKSELYPTLVATAAGKTFLNPPLLYNTFVVQDIGVFETSLKINYTLLDFGTRRSEISAAQAKLLAANLGFNYKHLIVIQKVATAYYNFLNATGLRQSAEVSFKDAQSLQAAAEERLANGLATLPDVLEARALAARANYDLQNTKGNEEAAFGDLATLLTASPTKPFQVAPLSELQVPNELDQSVDQEIHIAFANRPDLLALAAKSKAAKAEISKNRAAYFPTLEFGGAKGWLRGWGQQDNEPGTYAQTKTYEAELGIKWTVFDGFRRENRLAQAKAEYMATQAEVHEEQDLIADKIYRDHVSAQTALQQRRAATALLDASGESYAATLESYKDGVRNILDTLSAERELAQARAADVTARTQVLQTLLNLAFRTGDLLSTQSKGRNR